MCALGRDHTLTHTPRQLFLPNWTQVLDCINFGPRNNDLNYPRLVSKEFTWYIELLHVTPIPPLLCLSSAVWARGYKIISATAAAAAVAVAVSPALCACQFGF